MTSSGSLFDLARLRLASREPVIGALTGFSGNPVSEWLQPSHPARKGQFFDSKGKSLTRFSAFQKGFSGRQIAQVLAATAPNHCMDGWTYLSRALVSLLAGDAHVARHLAYYAQLRAALSILCNNGIGIFDTINFAIDSSLEVHRLESATGPARRGLGTHKAAWEALQAWSSEAHDGKDVSPINEIPRGLVVGLH